jgi:glycerophosphoryl diester phosphodiesterase
MTAPVRIIAHRGARAFAPENTIEAIHKAVILDADAVEIDVQLSRDGEIVVIHDDDLVRCTNARDQYPDRAPWQVFAFTAAEIRGLDAGGWFAAELEAAKEARQPFLQSLADQELRAWITTEDRKHYASGSVKVPTLAECLEACRRNSIELHVELKAIPRFPSQLTEKVIDLITALGVEDQVVISSFDHQQLARVRQLGSKVRTAVLTSDRLHDPREYLSRLDAWAYSPGCYGDYDTIGLSSANGALDRGTIDALTSGGFQVNVWTENDPARMQKLIEAGVTGVFTDYPNRLRALLKCD